MAATAIGKAYTTFLLLLAALLSTVQDGSSLRLYAYLPNPRENPDYERYAVPHPSLDVFGPVPQFATLRYLHMEDSEYISQLDQYCLNSNTTLGHVVWPGDQTILFANNSLEFIDYVASKGLYISSIHGFPPIGAGYRPPQEVLEYLEEKLGSRWFGIANGEQDGHYFRTPIREEIPHNADRHEQYLHFRDYFRGLEDLLGPRMTTLLSQTYPHYQLKAGVYTIAGAETSQVGPNPQIRYSFIRGAGKQYGVIWFGNVSIFNRFGAKVYNKETASAEAPIPWPKPSKGSSSSSPTRNYTCIKSVKDALLEKNVDSARGPQCGTSLNLMKRLMYAHIMYNSGYASFEGSWFLNNSQLSPVGLIQHNAFLWTQKFESFGTYITTVGLYLDFYNGWMAPRQIHNYNFHVWYNLPYALGDYLIDEIFRVVYPSYQECSYFHDETGESSATPYGDTVDVLLSDAPNWVLNQYDTLIVASNLSGGLEVENNLKNYVGSGGNLVITAGNLAKLPNGSLGVTTKLECKPVKAGSKVDLYNGSTIVEMYNMSVCDLQYPKDTKVLAKLADSTPLVIQLPKANGGTLTVLATPLAISSNAVARPKSLIDVPLPSPYPMLDHARLLMHIILMNATLFTTSANLTVVPTYIGKDQFYLLVSNPELRQQPLKLLSPQGVITNVEEIALDQSEKGAVGYLPDGYQGTDLGHSTNTTIAGVDTRLFKVTLSSQSLQFLPKAQPKPRPIGVSLHLRRIDHSIRHEILLRPTFFQHYDSVVVDYSYLITKDQTFLKQERNWLQKQSVTVHVDASPSIDMFPDLRLTDDAQDWYNQSIESLTALLYKMNTLGSHNLIVSFHNFPTGQSKNQSYADFNHTFHYLTNLGLQLNISLHLLDTNKDPEDIQGVNRWLLASNLSSMQLVLNLARLVTYGQRSVYDELIQSRSSFLYFDAPGWDMYGIHYANNLPVGEVNATIRVQVESMLKHVCTLRICPYQSTKMETRDVQDMGQSSWQSSEFYPIVMDAVYANQDEEFNDIRILEELLLPST